MCEAQALNEVVCYGCGCDIEEGQEKTHDGDYYCESCYYEYIKTCKDCGEDFSINEHDYIVVNGEYVCEDCSGDYYCCEECGDYHHEDEIVWVHSYGTELTVCETCLDRVAVTCCSCEEYHFIHAMSVDSDGDYLCDDCRHNYVLCAGCETWVHIDYSLYSETRDESYCENCYPNDDEYIHEYNYTPYMSFYGEGPCYLGVELEIDGGGYYGDNAKRILEIAESIDESFIYCKYDGSLKSGFEVVSMPMTLDFHLGFNWDVILNEIKNLGYKSHDANTCGLHIHVSRNAFGDDYQQEIGIMKLLFLFERFWQKIVKFSRRTGAQIERWAKRYGYNEPEEIIKVAKGAGKYYAVNLEHYDTIEIRIFRGTLNPVTFKATLQFVQVLVDICNELDTEQIKNISWNQLVEKCKPYEELMQYLTKKQLV